MLRRKVSEQEITSILTKHQQCSNHLLAMPYFYFVIFYLIFNHTISIVVTQLTLPLAFLNSYALVVDERLTDYIPSQGWKVGQNSSSTLKQASHPTLFLFLETNLQLLSYIFKYLILWSCFKKSLIV